jgi:hypothetical protein
MVRTMGEKRPQLKQSKVMFGSSGAEGGGGLYDSVFWQKLALKYVQGVERHFKTGVTESLSTCTSNSLCTRQTKWIHPTSIDQRPDHSTVNPYMPKGSATTMHSLESVGINFALWHHLHCTATTQYPTFACNRPPSTR